jgi:hypothetical protein
VLLAVLLEPEQDINKKQAINTKGFNIIFTKINNPATK